MYATPGTGRVSSALIANVTHTVNTVTDDTVIKLTTGQGHHYRQLKSEQTRELMSAGKT